MSSPIAHRLVAAIACALLANAIHAETVLELNLPSQSLADSLRAFGAQAHLNVLFDPPVVGNRQAPALKGPITPAEALARLLGNSTREAGADGMVLEYEFVGDKTVVIRAVRPRPAPREALEEVTVSGKRFNYSVVESANKMPLSVKDTPQSVKVITEDMLHYAGVQNLNDLYKLDAGSHATNSGSRITYHYSRGFSANQGISSGSNTIRIDGFRTAAPLLADLAVFERIELVKGSTSTLYGQATLAGTMNVITKKPQSTSGGAMKFETGSYDHYRGELDLYGPLTSDDKLTYRLVGTYTDSGGYEHGYEERSYIIAPSLQYTFTPATRLRLTASYHVNESPGYQGIGLATDAAGNLSVPDISRRTMINPPWGRQDREAVFALGVFEHDFADDWQVRAAATHYRTVSELVGGYNELTNAQGLTDFIGEWSTTTYLSRGAEVSMHGGFELFGRRHHAYLGADYGEAGSYPSKYASARVSSGTGFSAYAPDWSLFSPFQPRDFLDGGRWADAPGRYAENATYMNIEAGVTAQLQLQPTDRWSVLLGLRRASAVFEMGYRGCFQGPGNDCGADFFNSRPSPQENKDSKTTAWTYQAGTTFKVTDDINVYASYGQTFEPRGAYGFVPDPQDPTQPDPSHPRGHNLGPEKGNAYELGLKGELLDHRFAWSVGVFDVGRLNVVQQDPGHPQFSVAIGEQRSRGIEVDLQGEVLPGLGVYLSAVKMVNEFKEGELAGFKSNLGPSLGISAFANYELQSGVLRGLGFGGGLVYKDRVPAYDRYLSWASRMSIPELSTDITELDLRAYYNRASWNYELSVTNVLDEAYWSMTRDYGICCMFASPGPQVRVSATRKW